MTECECRLCVPEPWENEHERKVGHDVEHHYMHVVWVPEGDKPNEPIFAYTVGLWHQARHPELVVSGQKPELMHASLNAAVDWVRAGRRLTPGMSVEGVIGGFPVAVEAMTEDAVSETATYSSWFHRRPVDALQLVWTDLNGIWPWQPGVHELARQRQPEGWRIASSREGALAPDPEWVLPAPPDKLAFTCSHLEDGATVASVIREADAARGEDWQVLCDIEHGDLTADDVRLVHLSHLVRAAPSIRELSDLRLNERADRQHVWDPWQRLRLLPEDDAQAAQSNKRKRRRWRPARPNSSESL